MQVSRHFHFVASNKEPHNQMEMFLYPPDEETTHQKSVTFDSHSVRKYKTSPVVSLGIYFAKGGLAVVIIELIDQSRRTQ
jgi:hypothetical protein